MATPINSTNYAISGYWQNTVNSKETGRALEKLSKLYGVDYSAEDSTGLTTSKDVDREMMRIELKRLEGSQRSLDENSAMLTTADKALDDIYEKLIEAKKLAVQANQTGRSDPSVLQAKANKIVHEIDNIARETEYSDQELLNGELESGIGIGLKDQNGEGLTVKIASARTSQLGLTSGETSLNELLMDGIGDLSTEAGAEIALDILDSAIEDVQSMRGNIESVLNLLGEESANVESSLSSTMKAEHLINDIGSANETTAYVKNQILMDSGTAILAQANITPQSVLSLLG